MTRKIYVPADSCAIALGADKVAASLELQLGPEFNVIRNGSRGLFWLEPLIEVESEQGRIAYGPVLPDNIDEAFVNAVKSAGKHPLCLGLTEEIPELKCQQRLSFARLGITDPLNIDDYIAHGGFEGLHTALTLSAQEIVDEVQTSGLRGRGGAAFPTGIKWQTVLTTEASQKHIVCNADEGDSGTFADRLMMEGDPFCLIEGMIIAGLAVGADKGFIYLRSEYPRAATQLQQAIDIAEANHFLGNNIAGSDKCFRLELRIGAEAYICGEETSLLRSLEGKRGMVSAKPPIPAISGLMGQPTIVNNVITLASVPFILAKGAEHYQSFGLGRSRGTLAFQLAGNIKRGGLYEFAFGMSLRELVFDIAGGCRHGDAHAIQIGGPLGAYLPESLWDTELDYEAFATIEAGIGHGGIVLFNQDVNLAQQARFAMEFCAAESCGKCTPCRIGSTRGTEVMDRIIARQSTDQNLELLDDLCDTMELGSLCAMGGMTVIPVRSAKQHFPEDFHSGAQSRD
ncbi:formate dehydrogenase beta subunit [Pseudoteredinibacter isoporae]|uniref:NADH-quinone oxidoreductase subunit F n=1 Tax=Pseudoteredinibacter isoporae TaxID=570281 RepID=A0A7X0JRH9_9GAMM|nr:formate dehydrogenase beta subunit [Pseudoteredinibacter isoporae]MBB6520045.1 formate dehydrogenase iron-sulfur subunit [Pseudoteredinibacter isoporae]NHO85617.1 formate dehydrogenase [Pseudoteredinibacter isoporae]NIB25931.1 formate dehydrogenase [Pseudoteredinibacter isoporae]